MVVPQPLMSRLLSKSVPLTTKRRPERPLIWNLTPLFPTLEMVPPILTAMALAPGPGTKLCGLSIWLSPFIPFTRLGAVIMVLKLT